MTTTTFTTAELDELTVYLRQEEHRYEVPRDKIGNIYRFLSTIELNTNDEITLCSLGLKVLANYIADVPDNAKFVFNMVKEKLPIIPDKLDDLETINFFIQVQLILFNNILTTAKEVVDKATCKKLLSKIFELIEICEINSIEFDAYLIVDIFEEFQTILGDEFDIQDFLTLRDICLKIKDKAIDDEELQTASMDLCHKYSINLNCGNITNDVKEEIFFKILNELSNNNEIEEQILLNLSYQLKINDFSFLKKFINLIFKEGKLVNHKHIPMSLLIISNEILNEETMLNVLELINIDSLIEEYFSVIYPDLTLKLPWELQSIVLFNKIPVKMINISKLTLNKYIEKLKSLINITTLQINSEVIRLQLTFLSKIFGSKDPNFELIDTFLNELKLRDEYNDYPNDFKQLTNQIYFAYLFKFKDNVKDLDVNVLRRILEESDNLLKLSINSTNPVPIQINYLLELSKIFGFFATSFKKEDWFIKSFQIFENVYDNIENQIKDVKTMNKNQKYLLDILDNNIKFTNGIIIKE